MKDCMKFIVNNMGVIDEAEIDIGDITIVGGHNASGKSTVSKLLFCFLKYASSKRKELALDSIINQIDKLLVKLNDYSKSNDDSYNFSSNDYFVFHNDLKQNSNDFDGIFKIYNNLKEIFYNLNINKSYKLDIDKIIIKIDELFEMVNNDNSLFYETIMRKLLKSEFSILNFNGYSQLKGIYKEIEYDFNINLTNNNFNHNGLYSIDDVYYIDSFSVLDLNDYFGIQNTDHAKFLFDSINFYADESKELFDETINKNIIEIENKINELIDGEIKYRDNNLVYVNNDGEEFFMKDTASGIKQIGIIQLLLSFRKLKENSFLILDEPEVNLHPDWQFKLAQVLVLLSKKLNISIYINSHSPILIDSIDTFSEFYNIDNTVYHLIEKSHNSNFNIKKISNNELYKIYDDLGNAFDYNDLIRIKINLDNE